MEYFAHYIFPNWRYSLMNKPIKRWNMLDTVNLALFVVVILFFLDFNNNATVSYLLLGVFALWVVTLIFRNVFISKIENDPNHSMHETQVKGKKKI